MLLLMMGLSIGARAPPNRVAAVSVNLLVVVCNMNMTAKVVRDMVVRNMNLPIEVVRNMDSPIAANLIRDHIRGLVINY